MDIFILGVLILINGLFTMAEIALVSARKARLESQAERGDDNARKALILSNNPEIFLSAAQIGITLISILTGVYSGERFGKQLEPSIAKSDPGYTRKDLSKGEIKKSCHAKMICCMVRNKAEPARTPVKQQPHMHKKFGIIAWSKSLDIVFENIGADHIGESDG